MLLSLLIKKRSIALFNFKNKLFILKSKKPSPKGNHILVHYIGYSKNDKKK